MLSCDPSLLVSELKLIWRFIVKKKEVGGEGGAKMIGVVCFACGLAKIGSKSSKERNT